MRQNPGFAMLQLQVLDEIRVWLDQQSSPLKNKINLGVLKRGDTKLKRPMLLGLFLSLFTYVNIG